MFPKAVMNEEYPKGGYSEAPSPNTVLDEIINAYQNQVGYLYELTSRLKSLGHLLAETPEDPKAETKDSKPSGKFEVLDTLNNRFMILNNDFEAQLRKLNQLI